MRGKRGEGKERKGNGRISEARARGKARFKGREKGVLRRGKGREDKRGGREGRVWTAWGNKGKYRKKRQKWKKRMRAYDWQKTREETKDKLEQNRL